MLWRCKDCGIQMTWKPWECPECGCRRFVAVIFGNIYESPELLEGVVETFIVIASETEGTFIAQEPI